jgi:fatty-acyl-CoA synthase
VYGVADAVMGENVAASIILKDATPSNDPSAAEDVIAAIRTFCRDRIAAYKVPRHIFLTPVFPLTTSGKVQKYVLRAEAEEALRGRSHGGNTSRGST